MIVSVELHPAFLNVVTCTITTLRTLVLLINGCLDTGVQKDMSIYNVFHSDRSPDPGVHNDMSPYIGIYNDRAPHTGLYCEIF